MNRPLLLHIPASADIESSVAAFKSSFELAAANDPETSASLIVLVPAALVPRISTVMPSVPAQKIRQAAAFAIEDRLIGDLESQHLTVVTTRPAAAGQLEVEIASVDRSWLSDLLRALDAAGLKAGAVYADADCITAKPGDVLLWIDGEDAHWVTPSGLRRTWPVDALQEALDWALLDTPAGTLGLRVYANERDLRLQAPRLESLRPRLVSVQSHAIERPLDWLSGQLESAKPSNLLHGEFEPMQASSDRLKRWRWPLWIAAGMVTIFFAQLLVDIVVASSRARALEERIAANASPLLPPGTAVDNVVPLLERQWVAMAGRSARSPTLEILNSLIATPGASLDSLNRIELQPGRVTLHLGTKQPEQLAVLRSAWSSAGWQVNERSGADAVTVVELARP